MIKCKNYIIKRKEMLSLANAMMTSPSVVDNIDQYDFYLHRVIFSDMKEIVNNKLKKLKLKSYKNLETIKYLNELFDKSTFYTISWEYCFVLKLFRHPSFMSGMQAEYLFFLLYLYNNLNDDGLIEMHAKALHGRTLIIILNALRSDLNKKYNNDEKLKNQYFRKYLKYYLKTRKDI